MPTFEIKLGRKVLWEGDNPQEFVTEARRAPKAAAFSTTVDAARGLVEAESVERDTDGRE